MSTTEHFKSISEFLKESVVANVLICVCTPSSVIERRWVYSDEGASGPNAHAVTSWTASCSNFLQYSVRKKVRCPGAGNESRWGS